MQFTRILIHCFPREGRLAESIDECIAAASARFGNNENRKRVSRTSPVTASDNQRRSSLRRCPSIDILPISRIIMSHVMDVHFHHCPISGGVVFARSMTVASPPFSHTASISYSLSFRLMIDHCRAIVSYRSASNPALCPLPDRSAINATSSSAWSRWGNSARSTLLLDN